jgi:ABC-type uncharacterized transport system auxiliary subunit
MKIAALVIVLSACGGKAPPPTRYYQLAPPRTQTAEAAPRAALVIEPLTADGVYDDERMVYRTSAYRLDYYDYHRWGAPPGQMIASYLEHALADRFRIVPPDSDDRALTLGGRVLAIEEVDVAPKKWVGRISLELSARDTTGRVVWSGRYDETVPMSVQSPEGLAQAITAAMQTIAKRVKEDYGVRPLNAAR